MAGENGPPTHSLIERLREEPWRFDFFQAVRRLECAHPQRPRIGRSRQPSDDPIRFCQQPTLSFAPSTIASYRPATGVARERLLVYFFGLLGPNGPMPLHLTEYAWSRELNDKDSTFSRFLDQFNHRMISLFYRAWTASRQTVQFDRPSSDRFFAYAASMIGLGMSSLEGRDATPDVAKVHYAGWLANEVRNADGLRSILSDFFRVPTDIIEFMGMWMDIPADACCRLGESPDTGALGRTAVIGSTIWTCQQKFRIRFGPMGLPDFLRFLPGKDSGRRLLSWVRIDVGHELEWDVQLVLRRDEVPAIRLGGFGQLGWSTWLYSGKAPADVDDLVVRRQAYEAAAAAG